MSRNFGPAIVVFDGYRIPSTKYTTHQRRTGGKVGIEVTFTGDMKLTMSKDVFLSNIANKQNFIDMLSHYLQLAGCLTEHGGCRPVDCSYEEHRPRGRGRQYRSGHPTTQIQMASTCSCSVRHEGQRRRTAPGIPKSPKVSWVLTSATTSCS